MRILRVQTHEVAANDSSGATLAGISLTGSEATVASLRLAAGGTLGQHPAASAQVLAVLAGEAEVAGADGVRHTIGPNEAAVWEAGEAHQTWARTDVLAVIVESATPAQTAGTPRTA